jgi:hypothetical protein
MRKKLIFLLMIIISSLSVASCGRIRDPVTGEKAHENLRDLLMDIFEEGPANPVDAQNEFETSPQYEMRVREQQEQYLVDARDYYGQVEETTYYVIYKIEELADFNADFGSFAIPFTLSTKRPNVIAENPGPNFRLLVPPNVVESIHLYNENFFDEDGKWYRSELGALAVTTFYAAMDVENALEVRQAALDTDVYLRIGVRFDFPAAYQGYRFLSGRYEPYEEEASNLDSPEVLRIKEADLAYGEYEGKIIVKLVSIEIVDKEGTILYRWPEGLTPARTPTPSNLLTPTPTLPFVFEQTPQSSPEATEGDLFCPEAMEMRIEVGDRARVTYGDPRRVRMRLEPSTSGEILKLLNLGQEFDVIGGPKCADGFVWWEIEMGSYSGYWVAEGENNNYHIEPIE